MRNPNSILIGTALEDLSQFDSIIDVRSPQEFADDHIPGAVNLPVLSDDERATVGTLHKERGAFEGSRYGAALVSQNIARMLQTALADKPKDWRPLVYCWRGGQRSNSLATVLARVGWTTYLVEGGYKAYRRAVIAALGEALKPLDFRVIAGRTGTAKSLLLRQLQSLGQQVLDLEDLAQHKGSVLGDLPDSPQPSQRRFESLLADQLRRLDSNRPVYVESESKRVGKVHIPDQLMAMIRNAPVICVEASLQWRANYLLSDYQYFTENTEWLFRQLDCLTALHGHEKIGHWKQLARDSIHQKRPWNEFVEVLLSQHYDPAYDRAIHKNYQNQRGGVRIEGKATDSMTTAIGRAAEAIIQLG